MNNERRVKLPRGKQRELILSIGKSFASIRGASLDLEIPYSTMKNYALENVLLPESLFDKITNLLSLNKKRLEVTYLDHTWGNVKGGKMAMKILERKYPNKIIQWRKDGIKKAIRIGKHYGYSCLKPVKPFQFNEKLAEFLGAYLGDGNLTKYKIKISGDRRYDIHYHNYLSKIVFELFGLKTKIIEEKGRNTNNLVIYSKNLCSIFKEDFGLNYGDKIKNKSVIPKEILKSKRLSIACLRGLMDTDGSVSRRGRGASQFCIQFTSHNKYLLEQVCKLGRKLGIFTFHDKTGTGTNKWENIVRYFQIVGSSNLKHIVRFHMKFYKNQTIYREDLPKYFKQSLYRDINLPFKLVSSSSGRTHL